MEVHNGLMEGLSGVVCQQPLEATKGTGRSLEQLGSCLLQTYRLFHIIGKSPDLPGRVGVVRLAFPGRNQIQGFPHHIAPCGFDLSAQVRSNTDKVLHQLLLAGERCHRQALQDKTDRLSLLGLTNQAEGIVDMAAAITDSPQQRCGEIISSDHFAQDRFVFRNVHRNLLLT